MALTIPPKEHRTQQALLAVVVLLIVSALVAIFAKLVIGLIIFLLGVVAGIGAKVTMDNPLDKE